MNQDTPAAAAELAESGTPVGRAPLLLLDVDGPLNPYSAKPALRPDGYSTRYLTYGRPTCGGPAEQRWAEPGEKREIRVWLNPAHGPMLTALADAGLVELVWATAWNELANKLIGPVIGLPELPVIQMPASWPYQNERIWKRDTVEARCDGRPFAWFDDQFTDSDLDWATDRSESGTATLLVPVSAAIGLRQGDIDAVATWARQIIRGTTVTDTTMPPQEWCRAYGVSVVDPDGWRGDDAHDWNAPITLVEFERRALASTADLVNPGWAAVSRDARACEQDAGYAALAQAETGQDRAHRVAVRERRRDPEDGDEL